MGHSNGKITAPVGLDSDVYPTLGIGPTSDGYELGYACANTHGKINKWSKKKPVRVEVNNKRIPVVYKQSQLSIKLVD